MSGTLSYELPPQKCCTSFHPQVVRDNMPTVGLVRRVEIGVGGVTDECTREAKK